MSELSLEIHFSERKCFFTNEKCDLWYKNVRNVAKKKSSQQDMYQHTASRQTRSKKDAMTPYKTFAIRQQTTLFCSNGLRKGTLHINKCNRRIGARHGPTASVYQQVKITRYAILKRAATCTLTWAACLVEKFDTELFSDFQPNHHTLEGSFSAVSTPIFASKYSFFEICRDLQDFQTFAPL